MNKRQQKWTGKLKKKAVRVISFASTVKSNPMEGTRSFALALGFFQVNWGKDSTASPRHAQARPSQGT